MYLCYVASIHKRITASSCPKYARVSMHFSISRWKLSVFSIQTKLMNNSYAFVFHVWYAFISMTSQTNAIAHWIFHCKCPHKWVAMRTIYNCYWNLPENFDLSRAFKSTNISFDWWYFTKRSQKTVINSKEFRRRKKPIVNYWKYEQMNYLLERKVLWSLKSKHSAPELQWTEAE